MHIQLAHSAAQIAACFPTMVQLRPHLTSETFVTQVQRQQGYNLAFGTTEAQAVVAVAGFQLGECLAWGRFMYVYDLVVDGELRSHQYGQQLFTWLVDYAKQHQCEQLHLDSGVQRFDAHRFYLRNRMKITSHHFALEL
jgi:GNAT superfamily N-acetyltransferase